MHGSVAATRKHKKIMRTKRCNKIFIPPPFSLYSSSLWSTCQRMSPINIRQEFFPPHDFGINEKRYSVRKSFSQSPLSPLSQRRGCSAERLGKRRWDIINASVLVQHTGSSLWSCTNGRPSTAGMSERYRNESVGFGLVFVFKCF